MVKSAQSAELNELFQIATNPTLPLEARYAIARMMQQQIRPVKDRKAHERAYSIREERIILEAYKKGIPHKETARVLKRTPAAVQQKLEKIKKQYGLKGRLNRKWANSTQSGNEAKS